MTEIELTQQEMADLHWMAHVNEAKCGLYWPTVKREGPLKECRRLVDFGLAELRPYSGHFGGYFITPAGREQLAANGPSTRSGT